MNILVSHQAVPPHFATKLRPWSEHTHTKIFSATVRRLTELDSKVFLWIDNMHRANCPFHLH